MTCVSSVVVLVYQVRPLSVHVVQAKRRNYPIVTTTRYPQ